MADVRVSVLFRHLSLFLLILLLLGGVAVKADLQLLPPLFNVSLLEAIRFCWAPVSNATDADITLLGATAGATRCSL
jgi:hypothetical protein